MVAWAFSSEPSLFGNLVISVRFCHLWARVFIFPVCYPDVALGHLGC